jgi:hypothetical protein
MNSKSQHWLLLVTNLPGRNQTLRMRIWRALKAAGAGLLRDGVYVLPETPESRQMLEEHAREIRSVAGSAHILNFEADSAGQNNTLMALFDRTNAYRECIARLDAWQKKLPNLSELEARKILATIAREAAVALATDFFPGRSQEQMQSSLAQAEAAVNARFSPDEPRPAHRKIPRRHVKDFQGKTWATRVLRLADSSLH